MQTKRIVALFSLLLCFLAGMAQDVIIAKNGNKISGKVTEITDSEVKYKKASNPTGPTYTLKIDDLIRIDYENGSADIFSETVTADPGTGIPSSVFAQTTGDVKDTDLMKMYKDQSRIDYNLPKKLKLTGFIGGGIWIAAGIVMAAIGFDSEGDIYPHGIVGFSCIAVGAIWMPAFYLAGQHKLKAYKEKNKLYSMPIYEHDIFERDGKKLSMGLNYMANRVNTRAVGLGFTYSF